MSNARTNEHGEADTGGTSTPGEPVRIIAGSGRSGTTWILDALVEANELRPVFEPLHPLAVPEALALAYAYLRPQTTHAAAERFLSRVFDGSFRSWWTDYRVRPDRLSPKLSELRSISAIHQLVRRWRKLLRQYRQFAPAMRRSRLLVKFIRANLMLEWISSHFDTRIVLVLRHPGAVVESRLRLGGEDWEPQQQLAQYLAQADLQQDYLFKYTDFLQRPLSAAGAHTAIWCIENQIPLTRLESSRTAVAFYEDLLSGEAGPWRSVLDALELQHLPPESVLMSPSQSAHRTQQGRFDSAQLHRWHDNLAATTRREIADVLRAMDVKIYDIDDPMPRTAVLDGRWQRSAGWTR